MPGPGYVELTPDVKAQLRKTGIGTHCVDVAWPAERDVENFPDAARARTHHRDPVAQEDRLLDRMGDKDTCLEAVRSPH